MFWSCGTFNVNKGPTRCNSMQTFIHCHVTLHVSGVTHPSSGVLKTVSATSGVCHGNSTVPSFHRGLIRTGVSESCARNHVFKKLWNVVCAWKGSAVLRVQEVLVHLWNVLDWKKCVHMWYLCNICVMGKNVAESSVQNIPCQHCHVKEHCTHSQPWL